MQRNLLLIFETNKVLTVGLSFLVSACAGGEDFDGRTFSSNEDTVLTLSDEVPQRINSQTVSNFVFQGRCSPAGKQIDFYLNEGTSPFKSIECSATLSFNFETDLSSFPEGNLVLRGTIKTDVPLTLSRLFTKDTVVPVISWQNPQENFVINQTIEMTPVQISGGCSEGDGAVSITSSFGTIQVPCESGGFFSTTYSFDDQPEGEMTLSAQQTDSAGNASALKSRRIYKDTLAPALAINSPGLGDSPSISTSPRALMFSGSDVVAYKAIALQAGNCSSANFGMITEAPIVNVFTFTPSNNSNNIVCAIGRDAAGNWQEVPTASSVLAIDTISPVVAWQAPQNDFVINQGNVQSFVLSGVCTAGDNPVSVTILGAMQTTVSIPCLSNGSFIMNYNFSNQPEGQVSLSLKQRDQAGNESQVAIRNGNKQTNAPAVLISSTNLLPSPSKSTASRTVTLSGANVVQYKAVHRALDHCSDVNFSAVIAQSMDVPFTFVPQNNSSNVVCAIGRDAANNWQTIPAMSSVLVIDTLAPVVAWSVASQNLGINALNQSAVPLSGTCMTGDGPVTITVPTIPAASAPCAQGSFSAALNLSSLPVGSVTISAQQTDAAGNQSTLVSITRPKDITPPNLTIVNPSGSSVTVTCTNYLSLTMSGACSEAGLPVSIELPGSQPQTVNCTNSSWLKNVSFANVTSLSGSITVKHWDAVGNLTSKTKQFTKNANVGGAISDVQGLSNIQTNRAGCFNLSQDIDMAQAEWTSANLLGNVTTPFTGTIDGMGYRIKNLRSADSFIGRIKGGTLKNLIFERPKFGETNAQESGRGLIAFAEPNGTTIPQLTNLHVIGGQIFSGLNPASDFDAAGAFVGGATSIKIVDSTASVSFFVRHPKASSLGGLIGWSQYISNGSASIHIENSRVKVDLTYAPIFAGDPWDLSNVGGLIGTLDGSYFQHAVKIFRSRAELRLVRGVKLPNEVKPSMTVGGLVGQYWNSSASSGVRSMQIDQSSAQVDFDLQDQALSTTRLSGFINVNFQHGTNQLKITDSYAEGLIKNGSSLESHFGGLISLIPYSVGPFDLDIERAYSNIEISSASGSAIRPFLAPSGGISGQMVSAAFYNSSLISSGIAQDSYATPKTTAQMQQASLWTAAGYSSNKWNIANGSLPTLKNITVNFPDSSLDLEAPSLSLDSEVASPLMIGDANRSSIALAGSCSEVGRVVEVSGPIPTQQTNCESNQRWSLTLDLSYVPSADGGFEIRHQDAAGNLSLRSRLFTVDPEATAFDYIDVSTPQELVNIRNNKFGAYRLTQNIDLGAMNWNGSELSPFYGRLDGQGFRIKSLRSSMSHSVFIESTVSAQIKNLIFESPRLGGMNSLYGYASLIRWAFGRLSPTRLKNVHIVDGLYYGGGSGSTGGLVGTAYSAEIKDSTVQLILRWLGISAYSTDGIGGLVGETDANSNHVMSKVLIENSRANLEFQYMPPASATQGYLYNIGGLVGKGPSYDGNLRIDRSAARLKLHVQPTFTTFSAGYWGGLVGSFESYWNSSIDVTESSAFVDFDLRLPENVIPLISNCLVCNISGLLPLQYGHNNPIREIENSYANGKIVIVSPTATAISRIAGASSISSQTITKTYSNVQLDLQLGPSDLSSVARPFSFGDARTASGNFYNSQLMTPGIPQDRSAAASTTELMQTASTWLNAGYSTDIWDIEDGALPELRNITVQFPPR